MQRVHSRGYAYLVALLVMLMALPGQAGTQADPEIDDPEGDEVIVGTAPDALCPGTIPVVGIGACLGGAVDMHEVWITEDAATITIRIDVQSDTAGPKVYGPTDLDVHFTIAGTDYMAGVHLEAADQAMGFPGDGSMSPTGVAKSVAGESGGIFAIAIDRADLGDPAMGAVITGLFAASELDVMGSGEATVTDRAPDSDFGRDYTFTSGASADDSDGDGLLDAWETKYFGNLTASDGTGDADGDNLTDLEEHDYPKKQGAAFEELDPTNADTDGDGLSDGDEIQVYMTDPLEPDTDGDGFSDGDEVAAGTDPDDPDDVPAQPPGGDSDNDGLNDTWEQEHFGNLDQTGGDDPDGDGLNNTREFELGTDPNNADTDGDGLSDGDEVDVHGTDPLDADTDGDGIEDGQEVADGTDPLDPNDPGATQTQTQTGTGATEEGDSLLDEVKNDVGYLAVSAGGLLAVGTVSLLGLLVRWGL